MQTEQDLTCFSQFTYAFNINFKQGFACKSEEFSTIPHALGPQASWGGGGGGGRAKVTNNWCISSPRIEIT